ncbi:hypothetical protein C0J52_16878 [Blattella germanica]|nr:hypothetical protein C0J52_16878 [Blattella germanica]
MVQKFVETTGKWGLMLSCMKTYPASIPSITGLPSDEADNHIGVCLPCLDQLNFVVTAWFRLTAALRKGQGPGTFNGV